MLLARVHGGKIQTWLSYNYKQGDTSLGLFDQLFLLFAQVEVMSKTDRAAKTETAFRLFDKNKDGFITRYEYFCSIFFSYIVC
jgi:hypothetical protein